jgi:hypothetical protein
MLSKRALFLKAFAAINAFKALCQSNCLGKIYWREHLNVVGGGVEFWI